MFKFPPVMKKFEFIIKLAAFGLAFYYILDYIFVCEVSNVIGLSSLIIILIAIAVLHYFFGRKKFCPMCKK